MSRNNLVLCKGEVRNLVRIGSVAWFVKPQPNLLVTSRDRVPRRRKKLRREVLSQTQSLNHNSLFRLGCHQNGKARIIGQRARETLKRLIRGHYLFSSNT